MPKVATADAALGPSAPVTCFRCVVCGHVSAGRIPGRGKGDGSSVPPSPPPRTGRADLSCLLRRSGMDLGRAAHKRSGPGQSNVALLPGINWKEAATAVCPGAQSFC